MVQPPLPQTLLVGLHPSLHPWAPEIKYVLRTLVRLAGFAYEFVWANEREHGRGFDIYYGPRCDIPSRLSIEYGGMAFDEAPQRECRIVDGTDEVPLLDFSENGETRHYGFNEGKLHFCNDIVFTCYWLLTGARETHYPRDRWDNLHVNGSFLENSLFAKPLVSIYGSVIRRFFKELGYRPLDLPWLGTHASAAFVLSHDVDYPQIIRSIECLRLFGTRGLQSMGSIQGVLRGTNHFWKFSDWVDFEKDLGARSAFYFMARKGSLFQYALGTPDGFYDIRRPEFLKLFRYLRAEGFEIGLHASYNAYLSSEQLRREREALEEAAGVCVEGNRHHYWHLDPVAPHETLRRGEEAGFLYDSSLAFEFYPGFRRGICHPFHVFHPMDRRELKSLELPPAWMDDHFDRRLEHNKITSADTFARKLVDVARATGGIVVVDYHPRGMNSDFYPRYGPWLMRFIESQLGSSISFLGPRELARKYVDYEERLTEHSRDLTEPQSQISLTCPSVSLIPEPISLNVETLEGESEEVWDAFVAAHPEGNIYHTLSWKKITEEAFGHRPFYVLVRDSLGQCAGVLPLFMVKGLWGRRLVSVPMRDRGGLIARNREAACLLVQQAIKLTKELGCKYLELRTLDEIDPAVVRENNLRSCQHWITTRIDLTIGTERLWKALDKDAVRWSIKKGRRNGLRIEVDNSSGAVETFYQMFCRTRREMGIPIFPKRLFEAIWDHLISKGRANLFFVWNNSERINAMINFFSKDVFIPAYAAPQSRWRKHYPSEFMIWHTIEWAAEREFQFYDFGADSPRQIGLLNFKKKWGGVQRQMQTYYHLNSLNHLPTLDSSSPGFSVLRKGWKLLPMPASKALGSFVTKHLS